MKKQGLSPLGFIGSAVLILVMIVLILTVFPPKFFKGAQQIGDAGGVTANQLTVCKQKTQLQEAMGNRVTGDDKDKDVDRLLDECDPCVCKDEKCENNLDSDELPEGCRDDEDPKKFSAAKCPPEKLKKTAFGMQCVEPTLS